MKSNTSIIVSTIIAITGAVIIATLPENTIPANFAFAAGAILAGIALTVAGAGSKEKSAEEAFATTTLYIGNLPYRANETAIRALFSEKGKVLSVRLMKDKHTGKRRGFGFVEMPEKDAAKAVAELNEFVFQERALKVREANERAPRMDASTDEFNQD